MNSISYKILKDALSRSIQFLTIENPFKKIKNAFYLTLKSLFVLKMFKFLCSLFDVPEK